MDTSLVDPAACDHHEQLALDSTLRFHPSTAGGSGEKEEATLLGSVPTRQNVLGGHGLAESVERDK